jgi:hypothetical protein
MLVDGSGSPRSNPPSPDICGARSAGCTADAAPQLSSSIRIYRIIDPTKKPSGGGGGGGYNPQKKTMFDASEATNLNEEDHYTRHVRTAPTTVVTPTFDSIGTVPTMYLECDTDRDESAVEAGYEIVQTAPPVSATILRPGLLKRIKKENIFGTEENDEKDIESG